MNVTRCVVGPLENKQNGGLSPLRSKIGTEGREVNEEARPEWSSYQSDSLDSISVTRQEYFRLKRKENLIRQMSLIIKGSVI